MGGLGGLGGGGPGGLLGGAPGISVNVTSCTGGCTPETFPFNCTGSCEASITVNATEIAAFMPRQPFQVGGGSFLRRTRLPIPN